MDILLTPAEALARLLDQLAATLDDLRLSDQERRDLTHALREMSPPEEGLRQLRNRAFDLVRARLSAGSAGGDPLVLLKWLEGVTRAIDSGRMATGWCGPRPISARGGLPARHRAATAGCARSGRPVRVHHLR